MSHIHIPDGVVPISWWLTGFVITIILLYAITSKIKGEEAKKKVPFIGILSALMLLTMSVPLGILPFHLNLTVLMGILAGPGMAFLAVFTVNVFLSLFGHGGFTLIGINTLLIGFESLMGYNLFYWFSKRLPFKHSVIAATVITLLLSTTLMAGIVVSSGAGFNYAIPHSHDTHENGEITVGHHTDQGEHDHDGHLHSIVEDLHFLFITGWSALGIILLTGILLEALVISIMLAFILKVKPDIINVKSSLQ